MPLHELPIIKDFGYSFFEDLSQIITSAIDINKIKNLSKFIIFPGAAENAYEIN